ncbi:MAG: NAD(P)H-dependent flavin oxidoreductase [Nocardioidaceae bacterium]
MRTRTSLCDLLGIDVPIVCAPFGPWPEVALAAAVSNAGGLGSIGTAPRSVDEIKNDIRRLRGLTSKPFAVNHTRRPFDEAAFNATLEDHPAVLSFHLGDPLDLVDRAHAEGILWMHQVGNIEQAKRAIDTGVDVVIAQGSESGGNSGNVAMSVIVPQVVDVAGDVPVVAAGGIGDGRGLAAALVLGAQGVNVGTRFLASTEMEGADDSKRDIVNADARDAVKVTFSDLVMPPYTAWAYEDMTPRALHNAFVARWNDVPAEAAKNADALRNEFMAAIREGRIHEFLAFTGQSAALVSEVLPAAEIVARMVTEAERAIRGAAASIA